nr:reverse transcriptase domain-containing protein [Tanacetum cinerariifolium]
MRTRNSYFLNNSSITIPRHQNKRRAPNVVKPELRTIVEVAPMVDNQTMEEQLQAPTEGYGEAIIILEINADHFKIKTNLLQLVQANPYHGFERENPHTHINIKRITPTLKFRDVPNDVIKLMMLSYSLEGAARVLNKPLVVPILEPDVPKTLPKPIIPYPSRINDKKLREKATNQMEKFFQIFQDLHFDISFTDALLLMPKFTSTIKSLLANKDKLFELAKIPLNENCSAMLLKKLPEKLRDPGKFLIPCDFLGMDMTLELSDRSITRPKGVVEDVFVKVGKFHFPTDFVVVDFEADPRVPLILGRSFLRTDRALIDVYGEEITLRAQEILGFFNNSSGGNPTLASKPFISDSSLSLTPFEGSDFILEEIEAYLKDESISSEIDHADCDLEADICLIEKLLNDDPFQLPLMDLNKMISRGCSGGFSSYKNLISLSVIKKETENLAADHLSRLENPHKNVFENNDINENFPLETLGKISNGSTPWFADFASFHAYGFTHRLSIAYHPQTSGQAEVSNRGLKRILERTVSENRASCLWKILSFAIELEHKAYWALKHAKFDLKTTSDHQKLQLNELNELHDQEYENSFIYKEKTKKLHNSKIKNRIFNVGDRVLLFNSRLKIFSGKLKTRWSAPFTVTRVFPYGTVKLSQPEGPNFKVNDHRVKHYFGGDLPQLVVPDL